MIVGSFFLLQPPFFRRVTKSHFDESFSHRFCVMWLILFCVCVCVCVCVLVVCELPHLEVVAVRMYGAFATPLGTCRIRTVSADPLRIRSAVHDADPLRSDVAVMMHFLRMREVGSLCQHGCADPQMHVDERVESEVVCAPAVGLMYRAHCDNHAFKCAVRCCCMLCCCYAVI